MAHWTVRICVCYKDTEITVLGFKRKTIKQVLQNKASGKPNHVESLWFSDTYWVNINGTGDTPKALVERLKKLLGKDKVTEKWCEPKRKKSDSGESNGDDDNGWNPGMHAAISVVT